MRKKTIEAFILEAKTIHGDKYDYSKVLYESSAKKVCIICPEHGEFWQIPSAHLRGRGCPLCANLKRGRKRNNNDIFIKKCKKIRFDRKNFVLCVKRMKF